jgi:hypothetical protein
MRPNWLREHSETAALLAVIGVALMLGTAIGVVIVALINWLWG